MRNIEGFYYFWGIYRRRWGGSENYRFILTDILTAHVPCVWKRAKKIGSTTQSQDYQKTSLLNKKQSRKTKQKQENDQNRNLSYEVRFSSLSWKSLVETCKKRRTANRNKTNHEQFYSTWSERFWCQETSWTQAVTNHTNLMFNLVSCIQVFWLCYEIIPFIVSSGNLGNSRKWLVTDSNDFCHLISHCFLVFRF